MGFLDFIFDPGKEDREQANDLYAQSVGTQASTEAWKKKMMEDRLAMADSMLTGGDINGTNVTGALPTAQSWEDKFYSFLETSPDTTYNAQRSTMERGLADAKKSYAANLNQRGLSNSGFGLSKYLNLDVARAKNLSGLEGERIDRKGQTIAQGNQMAQSSLDRALNMGNSASGVATSFNTQVPSLLNQQGNSYANQASSAGSGIGQDLIAQASKNMFDKMFPTTVATPTQSSAGGIGQKALSYLTGGIFG
ncbi:MAG: hypothetical protein KKB51_23680 [Candidatus Riflebacteria bacterium]|nr:hypothetical protein [Candidatus Riflebacteria bacterium]